MVVDGLLTANGAPNDLGNAYAAAVWIYTYAVRFRDRCVCLRVCSVNRMDGFRLPLTSPID